MPTYSDVDITISDAQEAALVSEVARANDVAEGVVTASMKKTWLLALITKELDTKRQIIVEDSWKSMSLAQKEAAI